MIQVESIKDYKLFGIDEKRSIYFLSQIQKIRETQSLMLDVFDKLYTKNKLKATKKELYFISYTLGKLAQAVQANNKAQLMSKGLIDNFYKKIKQ
jgi:hypothetical protein